MSKEPVQPDAPVQPEQDRAIAELRGEIADLRDEMRLLEARVLGFGGEAMPAPARAQPPRPRIDSDGPKRAAAARRRHGDIEAMVGRYGTVALGALLLLMGAGVLLSWAVQRIQFGLVARVSLGAVGAAIVAAVGMWLRSRGARPFGGTLLAIALALVHVDAWGAGPSLQVIPNAVALAIAALASVVLAALAWRDDDQVLFCVGVGGAFLAPFVTASKHSDVLSLLTYGWVVIAAAVVAIRGRAWSWAVRLLGITAAVYVVVAMSDDWTLASRAIRAAPATFALACAAVAMLLGSTPARSVLTRAFVWIAALALVERSVRPDYPNDVAVLAALGSLLLYFGARREHDATKRRAEWAATVVAGPLVFLAFVVAMPHWAFSPRRTAVAAAWCAAALAGAWDSSAFRDALLLVAGLAGAYAVAGLVHLTTAPGDLRQFLMVGALAVEAAVFGIGGRGTREPLRVAGPAVVLLIASVLAFAALHTRDAFSYAPFLTLPSAAAFAVVAGWVILTAHGRAMRPIAEMGPLQPAGLSAGMASVVAFMWGREELARAFSVDLSVFLLVLYFAASGVTAIFAGRRWSLSAVRRAGLAVAVYAALKALYQTSDLHNVFLRIGAYVLVGSFLLAVAFWYRASTDQDADTKQPSPDVSDSVEVALP